jgi:hypothetical protein
MLKTPGAGLALAMLFAVAGYGVHISSHQSPHNKAINCSSPRATQQIRQETPEERTADYTEVLAWFTGLLALVSAGTIVLLWRADKTARISARAANKAANVAEMALTDLERPHIFMEVKETNLMWDINGIPAPDPRMIVAPPQLVYSFVNYGRTAAFLIELFERLIPVDGDPERDLPQPIDPRKVSGRTLPEGTIVGPDKPHEFRLNYPQASEMKRVRPRGANLFLLGYTRHDDIFGNRNITGFCVVLDYVSHRFTPVGDKRYNYTRKERDGFASRAGLSDPP